MSDLTSPGGPADVTHPRTALARLALSAAAAELADTAANMVPTVHDGWARPGDHVEQAAQLVTAAREALDRAVVFERETGTSWSTIGEALDITRQSAHERFGPILADWDSGIAEPWTQDGPIRNPQLPDGAHDPDQSIARLDQWATTHITAATSAIRGIAEQHGTAERMVSDGLARHSASSEAASIARQARYLAEHGATDEQREQYEARKAAVLHTAERIANQAGCTCTITDPAGPHEVRHRDEACPVHRGR